MRRILYLDHAPIIGGAEITLLNLAEGLDRQRFTPLVATAPDSPLMPKLAQADIESVGLRFGRLNRAGVAMPINLLRAALAVASVIRRNSIALIHTNTVRTHIVGSLAAVFTGTRVIWTIHDNTFPLVLVRLLASIPVRVVAVSSWLRELYGPVGLAHKMVVISNGIDWMISPDSADDIRKELRIPSAAPLVVNVGRLVAGKAPHLFIEAAQIVSQTIPNAYFILVGGPDQLEPGQRLSPYVDELACAARTSSLGERFVMTGYRSDVARFFAAAQIVVYCAVEPEGLPTVLLEAMRYAKPVVASNIGGAKEIVEDGVTGLLTPPGDVRTIASAITRLMQDTSRARAMGTAGRARLEREFDLRAWVAKIEQVYTACLSEHAYRD